MARRSEGVILSGEVFAENGDKRKPSAFPLSTGWTEVYEQSEFPERETFNYVLNVLYSLGCDVNAQGCLLDWNANVVYAQGAAVRSTKGGLYQSIIGDNLGNDPDSDDGAKWILLSQVLSERAFTTKSVSNALILDTSSGSAITKYHAGLKVTFRSDITNTSNVTINIDSVGAKAVVDYTGAALKQDTIMTSQFYTCAYDVANDNFVLIDDGFTRGRPGQIVQFRSKPAHTPPFTVYEDGSEYLKDGEYANLYAAIGDDWGDPSRGHVAPSDSNYFRVADSRGTVNRGYADGRAGFDAGRLTDSYQPDEVKAHNHNVKDLTLTVSLGQGDLSIPPGEGIQRPGDRISESTGGAEDTVRNITSYSYIYY